MKTDPIFYELFQTAPQTFFELLQITPLCPYRFESITVKATEKRIDGVFEPTQADAPIYFVEVQASADETMYWRTAREVATYFEARPTLKNEWQAVVIWLNKEHDPGYGTAHVKDYQGQAKIQAVYLMDLLEKLPAHSLTLNVLQPLMVDTEQQVRQNITHWAQQIHTTPNLTPNEEQRLLMVMTQLIEEKFKTLDDEELRNMLKLTPLAETRSGQKLLQESFAELLTKLVKRKFKAAEKTLARSEARIQQLTLRDLKDLFDEILDMTSIRELNAWMNARISLRKNPDVSETPSQPPSTETPL